VHPTIRVRVRVRGSIHVGLWWILPASHTGCDWLLSMLHEQILQYQGYNSELSVMSNERRFDSGACVDDVVIYGEAILSETSQKVTYFLSLD